jgi:predicted RNase H-like nuclease
MTPHLQKRVIEVHPEVCFYEMNNRKPLQYRKITRPGFEERKSLLAHGIFPLDDGWLKKYPKTQVASDDILDACAACWTAERYLKGNAICIQANPPTDSRGLRMEMWR